MYVVCTVCLRNDFCTLVLQTSDESLVRSLRAEIRSLKEENAKKDKMIKQLNELKRPETNKNKVKEKERQESHKGIHSTECL